MNTVWEVMHLFVVNLIMQDLFEYFSEICRNCILL